jgi:hypothetical protein
LAGRFGLALLGFSISQVLIGGGPQYASPNHQFQTLLKVPLGVNFYNDVKAKEECSELGSQRYEIRFHRI